MLKARPKKRYYRGGRPRTQAEMIAMAQEEWEKLNWNNNILDQMSHRTTALISAEGKEQNISLFCSYCSCLNCMRYI